MAQQSTIQRILDPFTKESVSQLREAVERIGGRYSRLPPPPPLRAGDARGGGEPHETESLKEGLRFHEGVFLRRAQRHEQAGRASWRGARPRAVGTKGSPPGSPWASPTEEAPLLPPDQDRRK